MTIQELQKQIEELKEQINKPKPLGVDLKHNHSGGDYARIKFSNLSWSIQDSTTKTTPTAVDGWLEVKGVDSLYYVPAYKSKTT